MGSGGGDNGKGNRGWGAVVPGQGLMSGPANNTKSINNKWGKMCPRINSQDGEDTLPCNKKKRERSESEIRTSRVDRLQRESLYGDLGITRMYKMQKERRVSKMKRERGRGHRGAWRRCPN